MARRFKTRFGTGNAGKATLEAGAGAVPRPRVAVSMSLRALAAEVFHQAAEIALFFGTGLELVKLVFRATVMHQLFGV